jgi:hypothetical protein
MPSLRSCSVGPPPSAIHGRGRLTRHPCRVAHCAEPPLGLSRGRAPQKAKRGGLPAGLFPQRLRVLIVDRSHAPRGNAAGDAPRSAVDARLESCAGGTRSVTGCIPTQSVGTISGCRELLIWLWLWLLILICLPLSQRPNAGVAQGAPRQGCRGSRPRPWMADGGGSPEQCRREGMPSLGEAPNGGAKPFAYFSAFGKVSRCKSETASSHHRRNGYAPNNSKPTAFPSSSACKNRFTAALSNPRAWTSSHPDFRWRTADDRY